MGEKVVVVSNIIFIMIGGIWCLSVSMVIMIMIRIVNLICVCGLVRKFFGILFD